MTNRTATRGGLYAALLVLALVTTGCPNDPVEAERPAQLDAAELGRLDAADYAASGGIGQVHVTGAQPGTPLRLVDRRGTVLGKGTADDLGALVLYDIPPASGYRVVSGRVASPPFEVLDRETVPLSDLYTGQAMQQGLNYIRMRDGITLAATVRLPAGKALDDGPFPTLIEYSGYETAAPNDLLSNITAKLRDPSTPDDPLAPATSTAVGSLIAPLLDFAVVSVQLRGSGCSGGAFDLFGLPTIFDGYDAVETVAAQPWVQGHKVGMVGISFSGYSQLFVGGTRPPSLAALAPMSVTADLYDGIGFPGGIFNTGFAQGWLTERQSDSKPAPEGGQRWAKAAIAAGDETCLENQQLHGQARDGLKILSDVEFREPRLFADRTPGEWAKAIDVPTFLVGGMQDEQLGSHWMSVIDDLLDDPDVWVTAYNGNHNDALQPAILTRWVEFLNLFVADRIPVIPEGVRGFAGALFEQISGVPALPLEQSRFATMTDVDAARDEFRTDPRIRVLMDVGSGDLGPGALEPVWEITGETWPLEGTTARPWYLGDDGELVGEPPSDDTDATYTADPDARPAKSQDNDLPKQWSDEVNDWRPVPDGTGLGWTSAPLKQDVLMAGASSADLYVSATAPDTDLQVTLTEVRPDGRETYVETGWLRASHRSLSEARSTDTDPFATHLAREAAPLADGEPTLVRVSINPAVHAFRAGSSIRITVTAPGGDRPLWTWKTIDDGSTAVTVHASPASPSALVLPVVEGRRAGGPLPACDTLRGQPCRDYVPASNGG